MCPAISFSRIKVSGQAWSAAEISVKLFSPPEFAESILQLRMLILKDIQSKMTEALFENPQIATREKRTEISVPSPGDATNPLIAVGKVRAGNYSSFPGNECAKFYVQSRRILHIMQGTVHFSSTCYPHRCEIAIAVDPLLRAEFTESISKPSHTFVNCV